MTTKEFEELLEARREANSMLAYFEYNKGVIKRRETKFGLFFRARNSFDRDKVMGITAELRDVIIGHYRSKLDAIDRKIAEMGFTE